MKSNLDKIFRNKKSDVIRIIEEVIDELINEINSLKEQVEKAEEENELLANMLDDLDMKLKKCSSQQQPKTKKNKSIKMRKIATKNYKI